MMRGQDGLGWELTIHLHNQACAQKSPFCLCSLDSPKNILTRTWNISVVTLVRLSPVLSLPFDCTTIELKKKPKEKLSLFVRPTRYLLSVHILHTWISLAPSSAEYHNKKTNFVLLPVFWEKSGKKMIIFWFAKSTNQGSTVKSIPSFTPLASLRNYTGDNSGREKIDFVGITYLSEFE